MPFSQCQHQDFYAYFCIIFFIAFSCLLRESYVCATFQLSDVRNLYTTSNDFRFIRLTKRSPTPLESLDKPVWNPSGELLYIWSILLAPFWENYTWNSWELLMMPQKQLSFTLIVHKAICLHENQQMLTGSFITINSQWQQSYTAGIICDKRNSRNLAFLH